MNKVTDVVVLSYGFVLALLVMAVLFMLHWYERLIKGNKAWSPGSHELVDTKTCQNGYPVYELRKR